MSLVKLLMQIIVRFFFNIYFFVFGKPKFSKNLQETVDIYKKNDSFSTLFALIRAWDSPFEEIEKITPKKGIIVDLGCGDGLLTNYLAISSSKRRLLGIETNLQRVKDGDKGITNVKFQKGDILKKDFPKADAILLIDVLHHLPSKYDQEKLILRCIEKMKSNSKLIIAEIVERPRIKYIFTWLTDAITVPVLFGKKIFDTKFFFRRKSEWERNLKACGLKIKTLMFHRGKPFSHVVFVCKKR